MSDTSLGRDVLSRAVAESFFSSGSDKAQVSVLWRQRVPVERLFMTYIEKEPMNRQYLEAEAALFFDPESWSF